MAKRKIRAKKSLPLMECVILRSFSERKSGFIFLLYHYFFYVENIEFVKNLDI
jgi:hypothetical protein